MIFFFILHKHLEKIKSYHPNSSTAILYFTRSVQDENTHKVLATDDYRTNYKLIQSLIDHTAKTIKSTSLPYFISNNNDNTRSFGIKLDADLQTLWGLGFENIIVVGNDCPALSKKDLLKAAKILQDQRDIVGRDANGGLYLIGIQKSTYNSSSFTDLPWETDLLADAYHEYLLQNAKVEIQYLALKRDINNHSDLGLLIRFSSFNQLYIRLLESILLQKRIQHFSDKYTLLTRFYHKLSCLRGPPITLN